MYPPPLPPLVVVRRQQRDDAIAKREDADEDNNISVASHKRVKRDRFGLGPLICFGWKNHCENVKNMKTLSKSGSETRGRLCCGLDLNNIAKVGAFCITTQNPVVASAQITSTRGTQNTREKTSSSTSLETTRQVSVTLLLMFCCSVDVVGDYKITIIITTRNRKKLFFPTINSQILSC